MPIKKNSVVVATTLTLCQASAILLAQEGLGDTAQNSARAAPLEEVMVTARRRVESLQDVPVSITALSADSLEKSTIQELENLTAVVPGFRFSYEGGANNVSLSLRGLGVMPLGEGVPSVVIYSNDVPLPKVGGNVPTYDLESIQVLKGPQGTLFGRNTIGGAVLITPTPPSFEQDGYLSVGLGNFDLRTFEGAANFTVAEDVAALRIAGQIRKRGATEDNLAAGGPDTGELDQQSLRVSLLVEPSATFSNTLVANYFKADYRPNSDHVIGFNPGVVNAAFGGALGPQIAATYESATADAVRAALDAGAHRIYNNVHSDGLARSHSLETELLGVANITEWRFGDVTLRNIFGYQRVSSAITANTQGIGDVTGPLGPLIIYHLASLDEKEYLTNELQLLGGSDRLDWIVGAFYGKDEPTDGMGTSAQAFNLTDFGAAAIHTTALTTNRSKAVFGQVGYRLTEALTANLGLRYSWDEIEGCGVGGRTSYVSPGECNHIAEVVQAEGSAPTWTAGLEYRYDEDLFLYATHRRGYRGVNINTPKFRSPYTTGGTDPSCLLGGGQCPDLRVFQTVDEEKVEDFEVGMKYDWAVGSTVGRANVSFFHTEYSDAVQFVSVRGAVPAAAPDNPTRSSVAVNAADFTIRGAELELSVAPTDALDLTLLASYVDQSIDAINVPSIGAQTLSEEQVTLPTPEFSGTLAIRYQLPVQPFGGELSISADYFYTEEWDAQSGVALPGYDLLNARVDLEGLLGGRLSLALWSRNVLDEEYAAGPGALQATLPAKTAFFGDPFTLGVEAKYRFQ